MTKIKEILRRSESGSSQREIARSLSISRNTVSEYLSKAKQKGLKYKDIKDLSEQQLKELFGINKRNKADNLYKMPDYKQLLKELEKPGVTMRLLWEEYYTECKLSNQVPYQITQFKHYFKEYLKDTSFSDILVHKPGEEIQVDWAGNKITYIDPYDQREVKGYLFVGVLPYSGYTFCKACKDMKEESWIKAHIDMFNYFEGVSKVLISDNLKTGVIKHKKDEVILNKAYEQLAEYYGTVIVPARVLKPKDKALSENVVSKLSTHIIARLRNYQFFSLEEYNKRALELLDDFNKAPYQKKEGSRLENYLNNEKEYLIPLPKYPYEFYKSKKAIVQNNSHISFESVFYSVPYKYIKEEVEVKYGDHLLKIYYKNDLIATHYRANKKGAYVTLKEHMPPVSNAYEQWNKERFLSWAKTIGENTYKVTEGMFKRASVEQQAYNSVTSLLKLSDKFSKTRLESACALAYKHISMPSYKNIKAILNNNQDLKDNDESNKTVKENSFIRGGKYYEK